MDVAVTAGRHRDDRLLGDLPPDVCGKVCVRPKEDGVVRKRPHDPNRVRGGAGYIRERLTLRGAVDVDHNGCVRVAPPRLPDQVRGQKVGQGTTRILYRHDYLPFRVEDLCRLGHKPDPAGDNQIRLGLLRLHRKFETVAHHICKRLDRHRLVVMRHDDCVLPDFKRTNLLLHCYVPTTRGFSRFFKSVRMERAAI